MNEITATATVDDATMTPSEVSTYTGISEDTLTALRALFAGPAFHEVDGRPLYLREEIAGWLADSRCTAGDAATAASNLQAALNEVADRTAAHRAAG